MFGTLIIASAAAACALAIGLVIGYIVASIGINGWFKDVTGQNLTDYLKNYQEPLPGAPAPNGKDQDDILDMIQRLEEDDGSREKS